MYNLKFKSIVGKLQIIQLYIQNTYKYIYYKTDSKRQHTYMYIQFKTASYRNCNKLQNSIVPFAEVCELLGKQDTADAGMAGTGSPSGSSDPGVPAC